MLQHFAHIPGACELSYVKEQLSETSAAVRRHGSHSTHDATADGSAEKAKASFTKCVKYVFACGGKKEKEAESCVRALYTHVRAFPDTLARAALFFATGFVLSLRALPFSFRCCCNVFLFLFMVC